MLLRLASAAVALPIVLFLIHLGGWYFLGLMVVAAFICMMEFTAMTMPGDRPAQIVITLIGAAIVPATLMGEIATAHGFAALAVVVLFILLFFLFRTGDIATVSNRIGASFAGIIWAGGLLATVACLRLLPGGVGWLIIACALAWGSDTGGYFAGKYLGKKKLYEKVSPKKTWAGSIGGILSATAIAFLMREIVGEPAISNTHLLIVAPIGAALGHMGDLAESLLKRSTGVKDSGSIMPGHGGLLDRVDALLFTGTWLYAYAVIVLALVPSWM